VRPFEPRRSSIPVEQSHPSAGFCKSAMDGGGIKQQRICFIANSPSLNVHGCTLSDEMSDAFA
jgi:hypothetical protein